MLLKNADFGPDQPEDRCFTSYLHFAYILPTYCMITVRGNHFVKDIHLLVCQR